MTQGTRSKLSTGLLVAGAFLGGVFFVASAGNLLDWPSLTGRDAQAAPEDIRTAADVEDAFQQVAEAVNPAVVQIRSTRLLADEGGGAPQGNPFEGTPFEDFFRFPGPGGDGGPGGMPGMPFEQSGLGSGAFIRADGYIVTNNHVIEGADELVVRLFDGRQLPAEVVGADPFSDLAVLRVEGDGYPALQFGEDDALRVGQWVLAFGSPLSEDLSNSVTAGIVSATGRRQGAGISDYIQTDAAINPGNSGGPLVNLNGEIVGINSAIATRTGGFQGIGFAVPVNIVRNTVEQLVENGSVQRGLLGIQFTSVTPSLARALDVPLGAAQIAGISEDADGRSPAGEAGLREGDVIVGVDGRQLSDSRELVSLISNKRPGDAVELTYNRDGDVRTATIRLGRRPADETAQAAPSRNGSGGAEGERTAVEGLGLTLQDLTPAVAQRYGLEKDGADGVLIADVERGSEAFREANLRPGFVIVEVDRQPVRNRREFERAYRAVEAGETFLLRVRRADGDASATFLTALTKPG